MAEILCPFLKDDCVEESCALYTGKQCSLKRSAPTPADTMAFGRFKGKKFSEIAATGEDGIQYLQWLKHESIPKRLEDPTIEKWKKDNDRKMLVEVDKALSGASATTYKEVTDTADGFGDEGEAPEDKPF